MDQGSFGEKNRAIFRSLSLLLIFVLERQRFCQKIAEKKSVNEAALVIDSIGSKMTKVSEEELVVTKPTKKPTNFQNGGAQSAASRVATSCGETSSSSGSDSDNAVKTASESSCSSVASSASMASSGTTTKLAARMADKVNLGISSPAEKRFKFEPNEDFLNQLLAMGISINGAKKVSF